MSLGVFKNGRHQPISPYHLSWAYQEAERKRKLAEAAKVQERPKKRVD